MDDRLKNAASRALASIYRAAVCPDVCVPLSRNGSSHNDPALDGIVKLWLLPDTKLSNENYPGVSSPVYLSETAELVGLRLLESTNKLELYHEELDRSSVYFWSLGYLEVVGCPEGLLIGLAALEAKAVEIVNRA